MRWRLLSSVLAAGCGKTQPPDVEPSGGLAEPIGAAPASSAGEPSPSPRPSLYLGEGGHGCALDERGRVACWGANAHGQLGDGTREDRATPVVVADLPPVLAVALGTSTTYALDVEGKAWCWGNDGDGQCARAKGDVLRPVVIPRVEHAVRITAGATTACAQGRDGELWCWGRDRYRGTTELPGSPVRVDESLRVHAVDVHATAEDVCVLDEGGAVTCWGGNLGEWDPPPLAPTATPEERHRAFLAWGGPVVVATGVRAFMDHALPVCLWEGPDDARSWRCLGKRDERWPRGPGVPSGARRSWPQMAVSGRHGCFTEDGHVQCWRDQDEHPVDAEATAELDDVVQVATGSSHACALRQGGAISCWGSAVHFATGDATMAIASAPPAAPPEALRRKLALRDVVHVEAGNTGMPCAIERGGTVRCLVDERWARVPGLRDVVELSNGDGHACARSSGGAVHCWGRWYFGPYHHDGSDSDWVTARRPRRIRIEALAIESWGESDCALAKDGSVHCWGREGNETLTPLRVTEPGPWVRIAMSERWRCGIASDDHMRCWAARGDMSGDPELELDDVASAVVTGDRGCALLRAGTVRCWGDGPTGDGGWQDRIVPAPVAELDDAVAVTVGVTHACARTASHGVRCWGNNDDGQLGDGTLRTGLTPIVAAADLEPLAGVAVSSWRPFWSSLVDHAATIVWTDDGQVWIWGTTS